MCSVRFVLRVCVCVCVCGQFRSAVFFCFFGGRAGGGGGVGGGGERRINTFYCKHQILHDNGAGTDSKRFLHFNLHTYSSFSFFAFSCQFCHTRGLFSHRIISCFIPHLSTRSCSCFIFCFILLRFVPPSIRSKLNEIFLFCL